MFYPTGGYNSVVEELIHIKHTQKEAIIKNSLFCPIGICSNHGIIVYLAVEVQYYNPREMPHVEF